MILKKNKQAKILAPILVLGLILAGFFIVSGSFIFRGQPVLAANTCGFTTSGLATVSSNCSISGVDGIDSGNLVISPNTTLTVQDGGTLVITQGNEIVFQDTNTSQLIIAGVKTRSVDAVVKGALCASDGNSYKASDGYAAQLSDNQTQPVFSAFTSGSCPSGYTKKGSLLSLTQFECKPSASGNYYLNSGVCTLCSQGNWCSFSTTTGLHTKTACAANTYNNGYGASSSTACLACPVGETSSMGASACAGCPAGWFSSGGVCQVCGDDNHYSTGGAVGSCSEVTPGYYSELGTATTRQKQTICPAGSYCSSGVKSLCSPGQYTDILGQTSCSNCACGRYGTGGSTTSACTGQCSADYYCPEGSTSSTQNSCSSGYTSAAGSCASGNCVTCPAGQYSSNGNCYDCGDNNHYSSAGAVGSCTEVSSGYYSELGTATTRQKQTICPAGSYCSSGVRNLADCGYYTSSNGAINQSACAAGYCTTTGNTYAAANPCSPGYYCTAGSCSSTQNACTVGHYCPTGSGSETCCPAGTWGASAYLSSSSCSGSCGASQTSASCSTSSGACQYTSCSEGYYLSGGACYACGGSAYYCTGSVRYNVSSGYYSIGGTSSTVRTGQQQCSAGSYCTGGVFVACPCGSYCSSAGLTGVSGTCSAGSYSSSSALSCSSCAAGYYCGSGSCSAYEHICSTGTYSTGGASSCTNCGCGTYNPNTGSTSSSACTNCAGGLYNSATGFSSSSCMGNCSAGYYCIAGSCSPTQNSCSAGYYCPTGSATQTICPCGTYSTGTAGSCSSCSAGYYCPEGSTSSSPGACTAGYYCPSGTCRTTCTAGNYCPAGSASPTTCPANSFCGAGVSTPTTCVSIYGSGYTSAAGSDSMLDCQACAAGYYSSNGACTICPAGSYCPYHSTSSTSCAAGTYSTGGAATCTSCACGKYGTGGSTTSSCTGTCAAGYCTSTGSTTSTSFPCIAGYSCAAGTCLADKVICPTGKYSYAGAGSCTSCACGKYGATTGLTTSSCTNLCSAGSYSTLGSPSCTACPNNTYSSSSGSCSCTTCLAGTCNSGTGNTSCNITKLTTADCGSYQCGEFNDNCGGTYTCGAYSGGCQPGATCSYSPNYTCDVTTYPGYKDYDKDGYGAGVYGNWVPNPTSYYIQSNYSDCYDSSSNVKPSQVNWWSSAGSGWTPAGDYDCSGITEYAWAKDLGYTNYTSSQTTVAVSGSPFIACSSGAVTWNATACGTVITTGSVFVIASGGFESNCAIALENNEMQYWTSGPIISVCK